MFDQQLKAKNNKFSVRQDEENEQDSFALKIYFRDESSFKTVADFYHCTNYSA